MEDLRAQGIWWLPNEVDVDVPELSSNPGLPERVSAGKVSFTPSNGGELELIGGLSGVDIGESVNDAWLSETIFGVTVEGDVLTLKNCAINNITQSRAQAQGSTESWIFGQLLHGIHSNEPSISKLQVQYQPLGDWINHNFDVPAFEEEADYSMRTFEVATSLDSTDISIWASKLPNPHQFSTGPDHAHFEIEYSSPESLDHALNYVSTLQNLLSLAYDAPVFPEEVTCYNSDTGPESEFDLYYYLSNHRNKNILNHFSILTI